MTYTMEQVSAIVRMDAAWAKESKGTRAWMVAHIMCESSGDPNASNNVGGGHFGLAQISKYWWGYLFDQYQWNNGRDNVAMAHIVYVKSGHTFQPWAASLACSIPKYSAARKLEDQPVGTPPDVKSSDIPGHTSPLTPSLALPPGYEGLDNALTQVITGIGGINAMLDFITEPGNWLRVAAFVGGGALVLVGLIVLLKDTGTARTAAAVAPGPIGKAVRTVT